MVREGRGRSAGVAPTTCVGNRGGPSIERMSPEPPNDARAQALAAVLRPILRRAREPAPQAGAAPRPPDGSAVPPSGASGGAGQRLQEQGFAETAGWRGAVGILPAVLTLEELQRVIAPWDGLIHRSCSQQLLAAAGGRRPPPMGRASWEGARLMAPDGTGTIGVLPKASALSEVPAPGDRHPSARPTVRTVKRSGWELIRTCSTVHVLGATWVVRHELARRLDAAGRAADTAAAPEGPGRQEPRRGAFELRLRRDDVEAWALRSGDRNALHRCSGAAAQAGLDVGRRSVVAHGLLLGALSLALVPGDGGPAHHLRFRFTAPLEVPPGEGAPLLVDLGGSCADQKNWLVLARA